MTGALRRISPLDTPFPLRRIYCAAFREKRNGAFASRHVRTIAPVRSEHLGALRRNGANTPSNLKRHHHE